MNHEKDEIYESLVWGAFLPQILANSLRVILGRGLMKENVYDWSFWNVLLGKLS
jgi:hypothetical protein